MEFRINTTDGWEMGIWSYDDICPRTSISELSHQHINHSEPITRSYKASIDTKPKKYKNNFHSHAYSMYQKKGPFKRRYCSTQTCYIFLITLRDIKDHAMHYTFGNWLTFFNLDFSDTPMAIISCIYILCICTLTPLYHCILREIMNGYLSPA